MYKEAEQAKESDFLSAYIPTYEMDFIVDNMVSNNIVRDVTNEQTTEQKEKIIVEIKSEQRPSTAIYIYPSRPINIKDGCFFLGGIIVTVAETKFIRQEPLIYTMEQKFGITDVFTCNNINEADALWDELLSKEIAE